MCFSAFYLNSKFLLSSAMVGNNDIGLKVVENTERSGLVENSVGSSSNSVQSSSSNSGSSKLVSDSSSNLVENSGNTDNLRLKCVENLSSKFVRNSGDHGDRVDVLLNEISGLKSLFRKRVLDYIDTSKDKVNKVMNEQQLRLVEAYKDLNQLRSENSCLKIRLNEHRKMLYSFIDYQNLNCLEIYGVPKKSGEDLWGVLERIWDVLGVEKLGEGLVSDLFRMKVLKSDVIVVKFFKKSDAQRVLGAAQRRRYISGEDLGLGNVKRVYVNRCLGVEGRILLGEAEARRKMLGYKFVWCKNGQVWMRKDCDMPAVLVKDERDLEALSSISFKSDTLEESSRYDEEVKRLRRANEQLVAELRAGAGASLSGARGGDSATSEGGPQQLLTVPGAMITTLARKVVSQLGSASAPDSLSSSAVAASGLSSSSATLSASSPVTSQQPPSGADSLEESMRKAQEDADVLRSLVIPLEEEINALKDKLRTADQQLRQYQGSDELIHLESSENSTSQNQTELLSPNKPNESRMRKESSDSSLNRKVVQDKKCDMCANYENQLVAAQQRSSQLEKQLISMERCKEELAKETVIRKDMEQKWNEKKEFHKAEVTELQQRAKEAEECVKELKQLFEQVKTAAIDDLNRLSGERQTVQIQLDRLQMENEDLIGKRNANARKLEEEVIDLPNSVEELQELTLKFREDLIAARVGQEAAEQKVGELREQLHCETQNRQASEASFSHQVESLKAQLYKCESQLQAAQRRRDTSSSDDDRSLRQELDDVKVELLTTRNDKLRLAATVGELKSRVLSLQTELKNSEIVQQDFVRLSQSLQTELERIRNSHTELRWEHEDDIEQCPGCHFNFAQNFSTNSRKKVHCLHCGRVFCVVCLTHTVLSGPKQRPSKVCDVCHTLLEQYTAPYFSTLPPHSPAN